MISLLLIVCAGIFKAISDTLAHHFGSSVFKNLKPSFWNPDVSWQTAHFFPLTKFRIDAWHLSNSLMIVCFCGAMVFHYNNRDLGFEFLIAGVLFNLSFNLFYNKILR